MSSFGLNSFGFGFCVICFIQRTFSLDMSMLITASDIIINENTIILSLKRYIKKYRDLGPVPRKFNKSGRKSLSKGKKRKS